MQKINFIKYQVRWLCINPKLIQGTLTLRFHEYLTGSQSNNECQRSKIVENVERISEKAVNKSERLRIMDRSYMQSIKTGMNHDEIIECLEFLVKTYPNQLLNLKFFNRSLKILLDNEEVCSKYFVKLCFLIGFYKKFPPGPKYLGELVEKSLDDQLDNMNRMDFAILCISTYKSSVRIRNKRYHDRLIKEVMDTNDNDTYLLVAFIKSLKFNQIESTEVIDKIKQLLDVYEFDYGSLVHILPYIADNSIKDDDLISSICSRCIATFSDNVRAKDIQKFLHSCALLNLKMDKKELDKLESIIIARTSDDEFESHFDHFVNATLSLWILNHHSQRLIEILFNDKRFRKTGPNSRIKLDSRMKLLETCVEIERPSWIKKHKMKSFDETRPSPGYLIKSSLERAMNTELKDKNGIFVQQINNLNIAGILVVENGEKINYEILDEVSSLSDKKTPNGIFQLKLRLLRKLKCNVKVLEIF